MDEPPPSAAGGAEEWRVAESIRRLTRAVDLHSRRLFREFEITGPQLAVLAAAVHREGITAREIAATVHLSASTLVGILDRLEAKGLVKRSRDRADRRKIHIRATAEGHAVTERAGSLLGVLRRGLGDMPAARRAEIAAAMEAVAEILERSGGGSS